MILCDLKQNLSLKYFLSSQPLAKTTSSLLLTLLDKVGDLLPTLLDKVGDIFVFLLLFWIADDSLAFLKSLNGCLSRLEVLKDFFIETLSCILSLDRFSFLHLSDSYLDILPHILNLTLDRVYLLSETLDKTINFIFCAFSLEIDGHFSINRCLFLKLDRILNQVFFVVICRMQMIFATTDLAEMF